MERYAQSETYYPSYQEPDSGVTGVSVAICRLTDGFWWDFNDSSFKNSGWTNKTQALGEDDNGLWLLTSGWAIPDADSSYRIQWEVTDPTGTFYSEGPLLVVNSALLDKVADIYTDTHELQGDWVNGGRLDLLIDAIKAKTDNLPADPASETNVDANETKIDTVDTVVDAIKAVTDNLPNSGALSDIDTGVNNLETRIPATLTELGVGAPAAEPSLASAIMFLYMWLRNRTEVTASEARITSDDGTVITEADLSDDGTTFVKSEYGAVD